MSRDPALAHKDVPIGAQFAQMIVSAAVAEPELEHRPVETADQRRRQVEAGALRLEPADEAVEPAHCRGSRGDADLLAQTLVLRHFAALRSWLLVASSRCASSCMIETAMFGNSRTMRMNGSLAMRSAIRRFLARTVAVRGTLHRMRDLADDLVGAERGHGHRPGRRLDEDLGLALDDQIGGVRRDRPGAPSSCRRRTRPARS